MKKTLLLGLFLISAGAVFVLTVSTGSYPALNTCFKASVSKTLLCSRNPDYVKLREVSDYFLKAVVMSEDDSFYAHDGFDWKEFKNSMAVNLRKFSFVRGGSTITQQLVKNIYLNQKKTISRKIVEAKLANQVERSHSKSLILEKYVNAIEFGKDIWGIKKAASFYFKKTPAQLNALESLYLVILLPSPKKYSKTFFDKELSPYQKRRMKTLLSRMKRRGIVSEYEYSYSKDRLGWFFKSPPPIKVDEEAEQWAAADDDDSAQDSEPSEEVKEKIRMQLEEVYSDIGGEEELREPEEENLEEDVSVEQGLSNEEGLKAQP